MDIIVAGKAFQIHKDLLIRKVPYFEVRLKECWSKRKFPIKLKDARRDVFEFFVNWLYTDDVDTEALCTEVNDNDVSPDIHKIGARYQFADRYMCVKLKNDILDFCAQWSSERNASRLYHIGHLPMVELYEVPNNQLLRLIICQAAADLLMLSADDSQEALQRFDGVQISPSTTCEILRTIWRLKDQPRETLMGWLQEKCKFHDHSDGSSCPDESKSDSA